MADSTPLQAAAVALVDTGGAITTLAGGAYMVWDQVDNTSVPYLDILIGGKFSIGATVAAGETIDVYVVGVWSDTVTDVGSAMDATGAIGATSTTLIEGTASGEFIIENATLIDSLSLDTLSTEVFHMQPNALAQYFGGVMPLIWSIIIHNNTAAALTSGSAMSWKGSNVRSI